MAATERPRGLRPGPEEGRHDTSPQAISASGGRCCRPSGPVARRVGASLSDAAGAFHRGRRRRQFAGHLRATAGSMAVGAPGPAIRHRQSTGCWRQYRLRGGRACPADGYTLLLVPTSAAINATLYEKLSYNFIRDIAPVAAIARAPQGHVGQSIGSGQDGPRVHRLRQGQSGQAQHGVGRHWDSQVIWPASCSR